MKGCPTPRFLAVIMAAVCVTLLAGSALAQYQTGNIYGKVQAKDGSVLPGVTVTLTGGGAPQTIVSDSQGTFHFLNLSPNSYNVKAELAGYGTATRAGVRVQVAQNADITITLNPAVAESITVTAEAPLLDTRKVGTSTNVTRVEMEKIPSSRDPWTVLQSVPSVQVDRINVGGNQSGQQSVYIGKGSTGGRGGNIGSDNTWNMDGVTITDMAATGSSPIYYDFDSFEELQITTGGSDPRIMTSGVQLNMVTKRGTNDFRGSGRYYYTPGSTQAKATVPGEASGYLEATNRINFVRDYGGEIGGPIWKDRIWFWGARGDQKISVQASSTIGANQTVTVGLFDNIILRNKNLKLNGQILSSNSAVAYYTFSDKVRNARGLGPNRPFVSSWRQTGPTPVYKLEDTQIFGSSLYLTAMWSRVPGGFNLVANGGEGASAPSMWYDAGNNLHDNYLTQHIIRPQKQYRIDGSKFFDLAKMNHELKFGFGYRKTPATTSVSYPGPSFGFWDYSITATPTVCPNAKDAAHPNGLPSNCSSATLIRPRQSPRTDEYNDFYVGDTILLGNLTIQGGLRFDRQSGSLDPNSVEASPILGTPLTLNCINTLTCNGTSGGQLNALLPALVFPGDDRKLKWNTVSPRIGATYSLGADKRTLVRASYNRYVSQMGLVVSGSNPLGYTAFRFYGVDANNDHIVQRDELMNIRGFSGLNPVNPTSITKTRRIDYGMKVPTTDEFIAGFERELLTDFSVGMNYTYRSNKNFTTNRNEKTQGAGDYYTPADYVPVLCTAAAGCGSGPSAVKMGEQRLAGGTFTLKDPQTGAVIATFNTPVRPVWQLSPSVPTATFSVVTNRPGYSQKFSGLELTTTKRMSHGWMLRANASYNDFTEKCSGDANSNPTQTLTTCPGGQVAPQSAASGDFGDDFISAKWQFNVNGVYVAPWDINIGANLTARQGYPAPLRDTVTGLRGGNQAVVLEDIGNRRFDNVYELDLRLAKDFRFFNRVGMTISGDLFNVPNKRTVLQRATSIMQNEASLSTGWRIRELQSPRVWRVGARFTY
jgi:hypothetical protein